MLSLIYCTFWTKSETLSKFNYKVSSWVFWEVKLVFVCQLGWNKTTSKIVMRSSEVGGALLGGCEADQHIWLEDGRGSVIWRSGLDTPAAGNVNTD